ncbi:CBS and ACT domain-containing protein [Allobaculum mucilyticum]|uniref:CBS and ACT domain-containing protein n=1 Tax=Allobaculum mucilyticum TaxID=2834459 RepID=UPI001E54218C|nr:CBS and ACT domain-containing protein [Allobaculum mucilyticum]UNT95397.1 CBS and ACT domain-containing protein [Allobaculum mucilyticum]
MFRVYDFMTRNPITVTPDEKISAVIDLMKFNKIHRIPVVNDDERLVGLITEGMIAADNTATSLSIYELNYLLSKTDVRTVMIKHPISINQNALMEEAAEKLLVHNIGCLPVVDDSDHVTGIITQNDIFKAFLDMLDWGKKGTRIILSLPEGVGVLEKAASIFADHNVSLSSVSVYEHGDDTAEVLVKASSHVDQKAIAEDLAKAGFTVLEFEEV